MKKKGFNVFYLVAILIMLPLTYLTYAPSKSVHFFAGGSIESSMILCQPNFVISLLLLMLCIVTRVAYIFKANIGVLLFFTMVVLWGLSGRTIGVFSDGRIQTGWFFIPTNQTVLCYEGQNCDEVLHDETTVSKEHLFFVRVKSKKVGKTIYVGPIIIKDFIAALDRIIAK